MKKLITCGALAVFILGTAAFTPAGKTVRAAIVRDIPDCGSACFPGPGDWDPIGKRCVCGPSLWNKTKHFVGR